MTSPLVIQTFVVSGVLVTSFGLGMSLSIAASLLPALRDPESDIKANLSTASWIGASTTIGWIPGFLTSSYYMKTFGRKTAFLLDILPAILSLILMYFSTNAACLISAGILQGITCGSLGILSCVVVGEYCDPIHRGMILALKNACLNLGSTVSHILGSHFHWRSVVLFTLIPYVYILLTIWIWPESPAWLASKDQYEKSEKAFYSLRTKTEKSTQELKDMIKSQEERPLIQNCSFLERVFKFIRKFTQRNFIMPLGVFVFAAILFESSGRHIFPSYATLITKEIVGFEVSFYHTLCFDILITVSSFCSSGLIKAFRLRTLLFFTGGAAFVILMTVCAYLFLASKSFVANLTWVPILLFGLYLPIVNFACTSIPLILIGEIFPLEHRAETTAIAGILIAISAFIALKSTPILLATVKLYGTFTIFAAISGTSLLILYFTLPETKNKTLLEIEKYFDRKNKINIEENSDVTLKMII